MESAEQLRQEVLRLRATVRAQEEVLRSERERTELYKREYEKLARQAFGRRSERLDAQDEAQLL